MSKIMSLEAAVSSFIHDGDSICIGGCTTNRKPYALVREIIRQGKTGLYLHGAASGGDADMLIGANCCAAYINSYCANSGYTNVSRRYRKYVEEGKLLFEDYSLDIHAALYHAAALGFPFIAVKHMLGSDLVDKVGISEEVRAQHPKLPPQKCRIAENPFKPGDQLCYIPVPDIDVALIHVQKAAPDGTCRIEGAVFNDLDMALGAKHVIISCEEIITEQEIRREPGMNQISCIIPDAIVLTPFGAHPSQVHNYYDYDRDFLKYYDRVSREDGLYEDFLQEWIREPADHYAYLEQLGIKRLMDLRVRGGMNFAAALEPEGGKA